MCKDGDSNDANEIVFCDGACRLAYHQKCISLPRVPTGVWFCSYKCSLPTLQRMHTLRSHLRKDSSSSSKPYKHVSAAAVADLNPRAVLAVEGKAEVQIGMGMVLRGTTRWHVCTSSPVAMGCLLFVGTEEISFDDPTGGDGALTNPAHFISKTVTVRAGKGLFLPPSLARLLATPALTCN